MRVRRLVVRKNLLVGAEGLEDGVGVLGFGCGIFCDGECLRGGEGSTGAE